MKKTLISLLALAILTGCQNDDTDFSAYTSDTGSVTTIYINYNGTTVSVSGDTQGVVATDGTHVTVNSQYADSLLLVLSGTTTDGSLLVNRSRPYGICLNGVSITNTAGPAINNQCKKTLYVQCTGGTTNTLTDGTSYAERTIDQKGTLFSEGQVFFLGSGTLNVYANSKNAIASDDYIVIDDRIVINTYTSATGSNGLKANDGLYINGGTLNIDVASEGGRGINCDSVTVITGGTTTINTSGDCRIETIDGVADTTSAACIKSDYPFTMTSGTLTMTSSGDGGKCINCKDDVLFKGGTLSAVTTGSNINGKPKAIKSDTGIIVSGGNFYADVDKSWACDNGYEDDALSNSELALKRITVEGAPITKYITKKTVIIRY